MARIVVCGGAGYIGSHTSILLAEGSHDVVVIDSLVNASAEAVGRAAELAGRDIALHVLDIRDTARLQPLLTGADAVIHFAALKAVGESCSQPLAYYENNIGGTLSLLRAMRASGSTGRLVFSSSATVYGAADVMPVTEETPTHAANPYGRTKLMAEEIIRDVCAVDGSFSAALLRYFNPVGAHPSGRIGEDPSGVPNNLMPFVSQVAVGRRARLQVFGSDYPTVDGTGVRDYVHVMDLAAAHVCAIDHLLENQGCITLNLGTGSGHSVLEVVRAFEKASGRDIPLDMVARRPGDVAAMWADPSLAADVLGWKAQHDLAAMCEDTWRWQSMNPDGFGK